MDPKDNRARQEHRAEKRERTRVTLALLDIATRIHATEGGHVLTAVDKAWDMYRRVKMNLEER